MSRTLIRGEEESRRVHRRLENCVWAGLVQRSTCLFYAVTKYGEGVGMYDNVRWGLAVPDVDLIKADVDPFGATLVWSQRKIMRDGFPGVPDACRDIGC